MWVWEEKVKKKKGKIPKFTKRAFQKGKREREGLSKVSFSLGL